MSKHSPGPWSAATNWIVIDAEGRVVCEVKGDQVGDARLIAAAPAMLAAMKALVRVSLSEDGRRCDICRNYDGHYANCVVPGTLAIIARVEEG